MELQAPYWNVILLGTLLPAICLSGIVPHVELDDGQPGVTALADSVIESSGDEDHLSERQNQVWQPKGCSKEQWLENMGMCNATEYRVRKRQVKLMKEMLSAVMNMTLEQDVEEPTETLYIEEDELVLPNQADVFIRVATEILADRNSTRKKRKIRNFPEYPVSQWTIPIRYKIDNTFSDRELGFIGDAIQMFSTGTCIRFEPLGLNDDLEDQHILFTKTRSLGCFSYVGKADPEYYGIKPQPIFLSFNCFSTSGYVAHELGHALGLFHEHQRPDRDDYISVVRENIKTGQESNFSPVNPTFIDYLGVPYDLTSDMHYRAGAFSKTGYHPTIETKDPLYQRTIGQRVELSFSDLKIVNKAYCSGQCGYSLQRTCSHHGYQDPLNCSRCKCPDGWTGRYCDDLAPSSTYRCGGQVTALRETQYLSSPGYNQNVPYDDFQQCNWLITAPHARRIVIQFIGDFNIYCFADRCRHWVEVRYKGDLGLPGPRFCCGDRPTAVLTSDSNQVLIHFKTPTESFSLSKRGFQIAYTLGESLPYSPIPEVNACEERPCQNDGICFRETGGRYTCMCLDYWEGQNCTVDTYDACNELHPCEHGGECFRYPNRQYSCRCAQGWTGVNCNERVTDVYPCRELPCRSGGVCVDQRAGGYTCVCPPYYGGVNCTSVQRPIDLAILIDSGSYYGKQWNMMTDFVRELLGSMAFGSELTQASLITFDREARLKASLNEHRRVDGIMEELHTTSSFFAEAYVYKALWLVQNELFSPSRNHGDRPEAINLGLVLTDSQFPPNYPGTREAVQTVAQQARNKDIGLLVIGVGDRVNEDDLYSIPENTDNIFICNDYQALQSLELLKQVLGRMKFISEHPQEIRRVSSVNPPTHYRYTTTSSTTTTTTTTTTTIPTVTSTMLRALTTSIPTSSSQQSSTGRPGPAAFPVRKELLGCAWQRGECSRPCGGCGTIVYNRTCYYDDFTQEVMYSFNTTCNEGLCRRSCQTVQQPVLVGGQFYNQYSSTLQCTGQLCCNGYQEDYSQNKCIKINR